MLKKDHDNIGSGSVSRNFAYRIRKPELFARLSESGLVTILSGCIEVVQPACLILRLFRAACFAKPIDGRFFRRFFEQLTFRISNMPIRKPNEDLFEETRMSFGEHLEELRKVLVRSLYGVAIGCIAGFILADNVVEFLQTPLKDALTQFKIDRAKERLIEQTGGYLPPELVQRMETERLIPLLVQVDPGQLVRALTDDQS